MISVVCKSKKDLQKMREFLSLLKFTNLPYATVLGFYKKVRHLDTSLRINDLLSMMRIFVLDCFSDSCDSPKQ